MLKKLFNQYSSILPDEIFLKIKYRYHFNKKLNLKNPISFNEKMQWLKINNRKPEYSNLVDKFAVRSYIEEEIGEEYLIPLLGVYNSFEDINFNELPNEFVLKPTHTSGNVIVCKDKSKLDLNEVEREVKSWMKREYYWLHREWPYKNVSPKLVCEKLMVDESGIELKDYKIFCFDGVAKLVQVDYDRFKTHKRNIYDVEWNYIPLSFQYPTDSNVQIAKPQKLNKVLALAEKLAQNHPYIRVDFYVINESIYFGELTFYPEAGFGKFSDEELNMEMGSWIKI